MPSKKARTALAKNPVAVKLELHEDVIPVSNDWSNSASSPDVIQVNENVTDVKPAVHELVLPSDKLVSSIDQAIALAQTNKKKPSKSMKSLLSLDVVGLDVLRELSASTLSTLFSELISDEMSRQFVYKCFLIPSKCEETFRSFGNESKAKLAVEKHLIKHIGQLICDAEDPQKSKIKFTAESVQARQRRISKHAKDTLIKSSKTAVVKLERLMDTSEQEKTSATSLRETRTTSKEKVKPAHKNSKEKTSPTFPKEKIPKVMDMINNNSCKSKKTPERPAAKARPSRSSKRRAEEVSESSPSSKKTKTTRSAKKSIQPDSTERDIEASADVMLTRTSDADNVSKEVHAQNFTDIDALINKNKDMIDRITASLLLSRQPFLDHSYVLLQKGKVPALNPSNDDAHEVTYSVQSAAKVYSLANKHEWSDNACDEDSDGPVHHDLASDVKVLCTCSGGHTSKLRCSAPVVGEEVIIERSKPLSIKGQDDGSTGCIVESDSEEEASVTTSLARPYPPMPKYLPDLGTKLVIPEEEIGLPTGDEFPTTWDLENNPDHVKKYAIMCMRELKSARGMGTRNCQVSCKICEKQFTAVATLMYHYRSHANIKPYVCLLCNASFTRQHSLNYHMLIHNGASRFKCKDCGRSFRHPSHFKEHQRRHTGEQPYKCSFCSYRFKTRNSYKRHMLTRHPGENYKVRSTKETKAVPLAGKKTTHTESSPKTEEFSPEVKANSALTDKQKDSSAIVATKHAAGKSAPHMPAVTSSALIIVPSSVAQKQMNLPDQSTIPLYRLVPVTGVVERQNNVTIIKLPAQNKPGSVIRQSQPSVQIVEKGSTLASDETKAVHVVPDTKTKEKKPSPKVVHIIEKNVTGILPPTVITQIVQKNMVDVAVKEHVANGEGVGPGFSTYRIASDGITLEDHNDTSFLCLEDEIPP